ncbi:MAG: phytanoyl-CoA dioxygenase family protein [Bacteroidota bacterium]
MIDTMDAHADFALGKEEVEFFHLNGYVVVGDLLDAAELQHYRLLYRRFLSGEIDSGRNRSDLGGHASRKQSNVENVTQIMWPSDFVQDLVDRPYHRRALSVARQLIGRDAALDFDMLIDKAPNTHSPTPWHQDAAYWMKLEDTHAVSCWLALDDALLENGCMWYVPGSHRREIRPHRKAGAGGGALECDCSEDEGVAVPVRAGTCIFHHGATLHYSRGNGTANHRRAFILNYRPAVMIARERDQGFDHARTNNDRQIRNEDART